MTRPHNAPESARSVALDTLIKVLKEKSYSNIQLNRALKNSALSDRDKHLATQIVYGTIQYKLFLEYQIKGMLKSQPKEDFVIPLLLLSIYQMDFLDKVPTHAIINEANELAKQYSRGGSYKLINAILRDVDRSEIKLPDAKNEVEYLSIKESMPVWLVEYLIKNFGIEKAKDMLASFNTVPHNSIRINQALTNVPDVIEELEGEGFETEVSKVTPNNIVVNHGGVVETHLFQDGYITIQDESASLAVEALKVEPDDYVLDGCSAPGGKTIQIAETLKQGTGHVVALDIHAKKLKLVLENAQRMQVAEQIEVKELDARKSSSYFSAGKFDKILIDAPCSGLGLLRRKPEIRYEKSYQDVLNLAKIQLAILSDVAPLLKPNGRLVYSTCTITLEENELVLAKFLESFPQFEVEKIKLDNVFGDETGLRISPEDYQSDGFYITSLRLRG